GHVRLPTPSPGFVPPILPTPNQTFSPVAASSPFGNVRSNMPAIAIPAPSGLPAAGARRSIVFRKLPIPAGALAGLIVACFGLGLLVGLGVGGRAPERDIAVAPAAAAAPTHVAAAPTPPPAPPVAAQPAPTPPPAPPSIPTEAVHTPPPPPA